MIYSLWEVIIKGNARRRFFLLALCIGVTSTTSNFPQASDNNRSLNSNGYIWPTNLTPSLSSTFCETRDGHYHFGLDIRTNGTEGYPCYAVADGDVVRVRVSPYGYGKALYLQLANGKLAVYGHLQRFAPEIERLVEESQYSRQQYRTQLWFKPEELSFKQGDIIAYTGSTGIGYPHLHFEIRNDENYLNAMQFGFTVPDTRQPVLTKLAFIPMDIDAEIDGQFDPVIYSLRTGNSKGRSNYNLSETPRLHGNIGIAVSGFDQANGANNRMSFYGMVLYIDDTLRFSVHYDDIGFYETKEIELERDFRLMRRGEGVFHHLWRDENMTTSFYGVTNGLIRTEDETPGPHQFTLIINDFHGNTATLKGDFVIADSSTYPEIKPYSIIDGFFGLLFHDDSTSQECELSLNENFFDDYVTIQLMQQPSWSMVKGHLYHPIESAVPLIKQGDSWIGKFPLLQVNPADWRLELTVTDSSGTVQSCEHTWHIQPIPLSGGDAISDDGLFSAHFDQGDLYKPIYCRIDEGEDPSDETSVSKVYMLEPRDVPIKGNVGISYTIPSEEEHPEQLGFYYFSKKNEWQFVDNDRIKVPGKLYAETPALETYVVLRDVEPPELRWISPSLTTTDAQPTFKFTAEDELSGVDDRTVQFLVDGHWVLLEYDFEKDILRGTPRNSLSSGEHQIELTVGDFNGNEASLKRILTVTNP